MDVTVQGLEGVVLSCVFLFSGSSRRTCGCVVAGVQAESNACRTGGDAGGFRVSERRPGCVRRDRVRPRRTW